MRIGIDIDDVLYPWYVTAHGICERAGITNGVTPSSWRAYEDYGCTDEAWYAALAAATLTGELYEAAPLEDAAVQLQRLRDAGHTVHLVTARGFMQHGDLIKAWTIRWILDHEVPHDSLTFSRDKTLVRTDAFLDDAPHNYDELLAAGVAVWLLHAPHNVGQRRDRLCVASLREFVDIQLEEENR
jgi:hypothetical protein